MCACCLFGCCCLDDMVPKIPLRGERVDVTESVRLCCSLQLYCFLTILFFKKKKTKGKEMRERRSTVVVDAACLFHPPPFPSSLPPCVCLPRIFLFFSLSLSFFSFTLSCHFVSCVPALAQTVPKQKDTIE